MASHIGDTTPDSVPDHATTSNELSSMTAPPTAPPTPSAGSRVVSIPELLEMILLNLSPKDLKLKIYTNINFPHLNTLLSSQLTSRAFYDTVKSSPKLQDALSKAKLKKDLDRWSSELKEKMDAEVRSRVEALEEEMSR